MHSATLSIGRLLSLGVNVAFEADKRFVALPFTISEKSSKPIPVTGSAMVPSVNRKTTSSESVVARSSDTSEEPTEGEFTSSVNETAALVEGGVPIDVASATIE